IFLASTLETYARGRGSGRGSHRSSNRNISRQGPARTGSMRSSDYGSRSRSSSRNVQRSSSNTGSQAQRKQKAQDYKAANPDKAKDFQDKRADNAKDFQDDRQDYQTGKREDWQDYGNNARNDRQEFYDDNDYHGYNDDWEWGDNVEYPVGAMAAVAVGTALTYSAFNSMTCNPTTVYANGVAYYQCGSTWYNQAYQQGDVVYVVVDTPPGY
ncbi:MAG: hypothetical protein ACREN0_05060, partial [Thermodesulfobacteriota bacterium]